MAPKTIGTVGILGCGWLGKALAVRLLNHNINVKGTTTSIDKLKELQNLGLSAYQVEFSDNQIIGDLDKFLEDLETLIISIPPKHQEGDETLYKALMRILKIHNLKHIKRILYVSSTGVFEDGEDCTYDEDSKSNASSAKGQYLIQLEELFAFRNFNTDASVLRLGGLIKNGGRHPVYYLAGKTGIANPDAPVNLIEQNDAVELIIAILRTEKLQPVYHGVYPWHPSRKEYYSQKAIDLELQLPEFKNPQKSSGKRICSEKTSRYLNFTFSSKI